MVGITFMVFITFMGDTGIITVVCEFCFFSNTSQEREGYSRKRDYQKKHLRDYNRPNVPGLSYFDNLDRILRHVCPTSKLQKTR